MITIPQWYETPQAQTIALGLVFLLLFAAYTTIQFYAASTYGPTLAANSVSALYATFSCSCFIAPTLIQSPQRSMAIGILGGYVTFVILSLLYFQGWCGSWVVVLGGVRVGWGAALLWTAQGQLLLQYAAAEDQEQRSHHSQRQSGRLLGIFWAVFQCSSLVGGAISFAYYFRIGPTTDPIIEIEDKPTGSTSLYLIFLFLMILSAVMTQFLLPPSHLKSLRTDDHRQLSPALGNQSGGDDGNHGIWEETALLQNEYPGKFTRGSLQNENSTNRSTSDNTTGDKTISWMKETKATFSLFTTHRSMQLLALIFFYTGFSQPYQQATFTRFFSKRTIGIELIFFHAMEIVGAIVCGRILDRPSLQQPTATTTSAAHSSHHKANSIRCLAIFLVVNSIGNLLAFMQEKEAISGDSEVDGIAPPTIELIVIDIASPWFSFCWPSCALLCWGFADAQIQVYCYWLIGKIFRLSEDSSGDFSRAVAFYKCVQSLGYTFGFYLIPQTRISAIHQIGVSCVVFLVGTGLALVQLATFA